ncbi:DUF3616 domain-containing protein [Actinopolyspora erythraea]|uniref:DUF3616 domain-containing protein n=1 Tax=Actinopolyspora erythraea TaxID=414996 RepID=A0A099D879_9ACTN|nr:DUF3616 domain-containing protein [Actinopolyspora erythraea]ASU80989.1 DUF3616 domain-containing protein [Actinopolyspora erythraea]KGI82126.1 hypothetical protein IL38_07425 [Actinopolyspora erythraea]
MHHEIERRMALRFHEESVDAETHVNISAIRGDDGCLWLAGDETATVERMHVAGGEHPDSYGEQRTFRLADLVPLPGPADEEADIEGLGLDGDWLWAVGSHSLVRKKVKPKHDDTKAAKRLAKVRDEANRHIVARLAVERDGGGPPRLVREASDGRRSAVLGARRRDSLTEALAEDPHLSPFLRIPAKDNGIDVEGIAVKGENLFLGLRGPVLRGWAVLLEIAPTEGTEAGELTLGGFGGSRYRKHFLDLGGLGIRDLCPRGDDLLVLAGPSMDLDGPVRLHRWQGATKSEAPEVVRSEQLPVELDLPHGAGDDHAEGISVMSESDGDKLFVVYDSPAAHRVATEHVVLGDVFALP